MVAHPQPSAPSSVVAAAVKAAGGPAQLAERIEARPAEAGAFRDVTSPTEAYDLLLDREVVGQVVRDETELKGMPHGGRQWVLVQRDGDYSLATETADEAIAQGCSIVASRLAETGENPSAGGQLRRGPARPPAPVIAAVAVLGLALLGLALRERGR